MVRIPLDNDRRTALRRSPLFLGRIDGGGVRGRNGLGQDGLEGRSLQVDGQRHLHPWAATPVIARHHPQEVGLDPTGPVQPERAAKVAMCRGDMANVGPIGLIDDHRPRIIVRQDVASCGRPARQLDEIWLQDGDYLAGGQGAVPCTERRTGATLTKQDGNG